MNRPRWMMVAAMTTGLGFSLVTPAVAQTEVACTPACGVGEVCVNGTCMVPAARAPQPAAAPTADVAPPAAAPAPPIATPPAPARTAVRPTSPPAPPRIRKGGLFIPYLGIHSFQDSDNSAMDAGLRLGGIIGGYAGNQWSLNVGLGFDLLNPPSALGLDLSGQMGEVTFSPLVHLGNSQAEFVVGPKVGGWIMHINAQETAMPVNEVDGHSEGWLIGGNTGVFLHATGVSAGVLMSLDVRDVLYTCASGLGMHECRSSGSSATILGFSFALLL